MPQPKSYSLRAGEPARLHLAWEGSTVHVALDGQRVASLAGPSGLKQGWRTTLDDGRIVEVRTLRRALLPELAILVDGRHVDDSPSHPRKMLRASAQGLLMGGALFVIMALTGRRALTAVSVGYELVLMVGALLMLGRYVAGVWLVALVTTLDLALIVMYFGQPTMSQWMITLLLRLLFATFVYRSYLAIRDLRRS